jgi:hypothetical protein
MKHTKKMVMVPETEYLALLSMIRGGDSLQSERSTLQGDIIRNLNNPNISQDEKAKTHSMLIKKRKQIQGIIENKPQKVTFDIPANLPNLAPYLGIEQRTPRRRYEESSDYTGSSISNESETPVFQDASQQLATPEIKQRTEGKPIIDPKYSKLLYEYVTKNKDDFQITAGGKVSDYKRQPIQKSDYSKILDFMTGKIDSPPIGTKFLKERLMKSEFVKRLSSPMKGEGKRVLIKVRTIKTPLLPREGKKIVFKPRLWARI